MRLRFVETLPERKTVGKPKGSAYEEILQEFVSSGQSQAVLDLAEGKRPQTAVNSLKKFAKSKNLPVSVFMSAAGDVCMERLGDAVPENGAPASNGASTGGQPVIPAAGRAARKAQEPVIA